jgi:dihydroxy-acid dehydratase
MLIDASELATRSLALEKLGGFASPENQSPWQEIFRDRVGRFDEGMTLRGATEYQDISRKHMPRDNH